MSHIDIERLLILTRINSLVFKCEYIVWMLNNWCNSGFALASWRPCEPRCVRSLGQSQCCNKLRLLSLNAWLMQHENTPDVVWVNFNLRIVLIYFSIWLKMKGFFCYQLIVCGLASIHDEIWDGEFNRIGIQDRALRFNESCDALEESKKCEDSCATEAQDCYLPCEDQEKWWLVLVNIWLTPILLLLQIWTTYFCE